MVDVRGMAGQTILNAKLDDDALWLTFSGGVLKVFDNGQSCCESRYVTTDYDPTSLIGGRLLHVDERGGPETIDEHGEPRETAFVEVATDRGFITLITHNEHNGYYGGFSLRAELVPYGGDMKVRR